MSIWRTDHPAYDTRTSLDHQREWTGDPVTWSPGNQRPRRGSGISRPLTVQPSGDITLSGQEHADGLVVVSLTWQSCPIIDGPHPIDSDLCAMFRDDPDWVIMGTNTRRKKYFDVGMGDALADMQAIIRRLRK